MSLVDIFFQTSVIEKYKEFSIKIVLTLSYSQVAVASIFTRAR